MQATLIFSPRISKKTTIDLSASAKKRVRGNPKAVTVIPSVTTKPTNNKKVKVVKVVPEISKTPKGKPVVLLLLLLLLIVVLFYQLEN